MTEPTEQIATPETDAAQFGADRYAGDKPIHVMAVTADFARTLERRAVKADMAHTELIDGIKRRIGSTLTMGADANAEYLLDAVRGMQRFVVEWEKRHSKEPAP